MDVACAAAVDISSSLLSLPRISGNGRHGHVAMYHICLICTAIGSQVQGGFRARERMKPM